MDKFIEIADFHISQFNEYYKEKEERDKIIKSIFDLSKHILLEKNTNGVNKKPRFEVILRKYYLFILNEITKLVPDTETDINLYAFIDYFSI